MVEVGRPSSQRKGDVWKIRHARKGEFTVRLLTDVHAGDDFFDVEIVEGSAFFMAIGNAGRGEPGNVLGMRRALVEFIEKVSEP